jgi:hypothetical protein
MSDPVIVSHVATHEYRKRVDAMTCKHRGCKRWRVDGTNEYCPDHQWLKEAGERKRAENAALAAWLPVEDGTHGTRYGGPSYQPLKALLDRKGIKYGCT